MNRVLIYMIFLLSLTRTLNSFGCRKKHSMSKFSGSSLNMGFSSADFSAKFSIPDPVIDKGVTRDRSPILLGTGSASRRMIMTNAGYEFDVVKADLDERNIGDRSDGNIDKTKSLVSLLATAKADAIMDLLHTDESLKSKYVGRPLLTADQVVVCNNMILEKPLNAEEARTFMKMYGDHPCMTIGSVVLTDTVTKQRVEAVDTATIYFDPISDNVIEQLIEEGIVYNCAGGLMIENPLVLPFIKRVEGSEESVMGLSSTLLDSLFTKLYAK
jgi:septum formation protein